MASFAIAQRITDMIIEEVGKHPFGEDLGVHTQVGIVTDPVNPQNQQMIIQVLAIGNGVGIGEKIAATVTLDDLQPNEKRIGEIVAEILDQLNKAREAAAQQTLQSSVITP